ncbi:unnamed protein product [Diamesa serratosioi]
MKRKTRNSEKASEETLKKKIIYLRVTDLHYVLNGAIFSKNAKKEQLQQRILQLLKGREIEELEKELIVQKIDAIYTKSTSTTEKQKMYTTPGYNNSGISHTPYANNNNHNNNNNNNNNNSMTGFPIQPDVKLKKLAFFDILGTLLQPSTLVPNSQARLQEGTYYFHLTPQQATDIAMNRDIRNPAKAEYIIQVQLRFCLLETSCEQDDYFPPNVQIKVNGKICPLPNPIPTNKPGVDPKRPPRPVNITQNVKVSPTVANVISVQWQTEFNRGFVISCYLVRKLTSEQLLQRMKIKGIKPSDFTRGLIKEKLNEDADCEIATTMLRVSLICPLGKMRMTTPCRASTCMHLQCFDASLYLQMNERKPTWNCPVCDRAALYENLVIDGYFQDVIASSNLKSDDNEIQLQKDGSWSTLTNKNDTCNIDSQTRSLQKIEVIFDDIELITDQIPKSSAKSQSSSYSGSQKVESGKTKGSDTVDLTISDSEEDTPLSIVPASKNSQNSNQTKNKSVNGMSF